MTELLSKPSVKIAIGALSVFAPIKAAVLTVLLLVISDLILGIIAARKRNEPITSRGLRRTITKLFVYEVLIVLAFLTQKYLMGDMFPICNIINSFIGLTELTSLIENLNAIGDGKMFKALLDKLNGPSVKGKIEELTNSKDDK